MPKTYTTSAIILKRQLFRETDTKVVAYSLEMGRLELVARGTRKLSSKLAGHLEPITSADLMVVKGRQFDYIGSATSYDCFCRLKSDYAKTETAGRAVGYFVSMVKEGVEDGRLFDLLLSYFCLLDNEENDPRQFYNYFLLRFLALLGYVPELHKCVVCRKPISQGDHFFSAYRSGLCCGNCGKQGGASHISPEAVKVLRLACKHDLFFMSKISARDSVNQEISRITRDFSLYTNS